MLSHHDPVRKKSVAATPEEEVRQQLVQWLHTEKRVPLHLMETEFALAKVRARAQGRVDLVVHAFRQGRGVAQPWLLAECKRVGECDWKLLEVQVNRYLQILAPEYLLLQIGNERRILHLRSNSSLQTTVEVVSDLPFFSEESL